MSLRARRIATYSDENPRQDGAERDISPRSDHGDRLSLNRVGEARRHVRGLVTERTLVRRVVDALAEQPDLESTGVEVDAEGATIVLLGFVGSPKVAVRIEDVAGSVDGVLSIRNELVVRSRRS
jgi:osmotically-inducible protein OsmY